MKGVGERVAFSPVGLLLGVVYLQGESLSVKTPVALTLRPKSALSVSEKEFKRDLELRGKNPSFSKVSIALVDFLDSTINSYDMFVTFFSALLAKQLALDGLDEVKWRM